MSITEQLRAVSDGQIDSGMIVGPAFATIRDLVLKHGQLYTVAPLPPGAWSREPQACYANALHAAITRNWVYVEGFAIPRAGRLAIAHAWVTDPKHPTVAYDPTWQRGRAYFGIPFNLDYVLQTHAAAGHPGVIDAWELDWPLLRGKDRIADAVWTAG